MAGDEGHRQRRAALEQAVLQLEAAHAVHADVGDQAGHFARVEARQERLGRVEALDAVVLALEQPLQRIAHRFVVVDDVDSAFLRDQAHAVTAALGLVEIRCGRLDGQREREAAAHGAVAIVEVLVALIRPRWLSMMERHKATGRCPSRPTLVEKNASYMRAITSSFRARAHVGHR